MDCVEILEDVVAFCKKEIEALEHKTSVDTPDGYEIRNIQCGLLGIRKRHRAYSD